jgi:hypothetical protein
VVQRSDGSFAAQPKPPAKGHYTYVDASKGVGQDVVFVKQASPTVEEAFDYGEHPVESRKHWTELERFKAKASEEGADAKSIANELHHYILQSVPKGQHWKFTALLMKISPEQRETTNLKDLMGGIAKVQSILQGNDHREALTELKNTWSEIQSQYRRGREPLGKLDDATRQKITDLMATVDVKAMTAGKAADLKTIRASVQQLAQQLGSAASALNTELTAQMLHVPEARIEELARLRKTDAREMTAEDIREITDTLKYITGQWELAQSEEHQKRVETEQRLIDRGKESIHNKTKTPGIVIHGLRTLKYTAVTGQSRIDTLVGFATGKDHDAMMALLVDGPEQGQDKTYGKYREMENYVDGKLDEIGWTEHDYDGLDKTVKVRLGTLTVKLPVRHLALLYAHSRSEDNLAEILRSDGLIIELPGTTIRSPRTYKTGKIEARQIFDAIAKLPDIYKRLVDDVMFPMNEEVAAPAMNETSRKLTGSEIARVKNYVNRPRWQPKRVGGESMDLSKPPEDRGRAQPRTGGTAPIYLGAIDDELVAQMQFASEYYGMTEPLQAARTFLQDKDFQTTMEDTGNGHILKSILTMFNRAQGTFTARNPLESRISRGLGTTGKGILKGRISGGLVQLTSAPAAFPVVEARYFLNADIPTPSVIREIEDKYPSMWYRWWHGGYNFITGDTGAHEMGAKLLKGKGKKEDLMLRQYNNGDKIALTKIYQACKRKVAAETPYEQGTPEYENALGALFRRAMRTQGQYDMLHRSEMTSSPNVFMKGSTMFMSSLNAFYNTCLQSLDDYHKKRISLFKMTENIGSVITSLEAAVAVRTAYGLGLTAAAIILISEFSGGEPEEKREKRNRALADAANKRWSRMAKRMIFEPLGLSVFGQTVAEIGQRVVDAARGKPAFMKPGDMPTGNMFADMVLAMGQGSIDAGTMVHQYLSGDRYQSGPKKGDLKWKSSAWGVADSVLQAVSYLTGSTYSGIKSDVVWPIQTASRALRDTPTRIGLIEQLAELTYDKDRGPDPARWLRLAGQEDRAAKIQRELGTVTQEEYSEWKTYHRQREKQLAQRREADRVEKLKPSLSKMTGPELNRLLSENTYQKYAAPSRATGFAPHIPGTAVKGSEALVSAIGAELARQKREKGKD